MTLEEFEVAETVKMHGYSFEIENVHQTGTRPPTASAPSNDS